MPYTTDQCACHKEDILSETVDSQYFFVLAQRSEYTDKFDDDAQPGLETDTLIHPH